MRSLFNCFLSLYGLLFIIYAAGFTLISSYFHYKSLLEKHTDDFKAFIRYFAYFFLFLLAVPVAAVFLYSRSPFKALAALGFHPGNYRLGFLAMLISLPVAAFSGFFTVKEPGLSTFYPFSKSACTSPKKFFLYELSYLCLYYFAWEFTFRGFFLFSLVELMNRTTTAVLVAVLLQSIISTVFHLHHPPAEVVSSLFGGVVFGLIAYATGSFLYTLFIHALIGIVNDTFLYFRRYKRVN